MHLHETILFDYPGGVQLTVAGGVLSLAGMVYGGYRMRPEETGRAGMMTAFVSSSTRMPPVPTRFWIAGRMPGLTPQWTRYPRT